MQNLSSYNNSWYYPGARFLKRTLWFYVNSIIFNSSLLPVNMFKIIFLKLFGAKIGHGVVIKPNVNIKYPWFLEIENNVWIGENVWIDNLCEVKIGSNCCISQGAMLLTGNHDYKSEAFDLIVKPIILENNVWIGAKSIVCPGIICGQFSVLTVASVASQNLEPNGVYRGNPAARVGKR